jgi:hypothetical protein
MTQALLGFVCGLLLRYVWQTEPLAVRWWLLRAGFIEWRRRRERRDVWCPTCDTIYRKPYGWLASHVSRCRGKVAGVQRDGDPLWTEDELRRGALAILDDMKRDPWRKLDEEIGRAQEPRPDEPIG